MQLPYGITFSHSRRRRSWLRVWPSGAAVIVLLGAAAMYPLLRPPQAPAAPPATLQIRSSPTRASVEVDGRVLGETPADIRVAEGRHTVTLKLAGYTDASQEMSVKASQTITVNVQLWLHTPGVTELRPPIPGSVVQDARFLADGRVAITMALPPSKGGLQAWVVQGDGRVAQLGPESLATTALAVSPNGHTIAYLGGPSHEGNTGYREVWATRDAGPGRKLVALPEGTEETLVDVDWSPNGEHLLIATNTRAAQGGSRLRLLYQPLEGRARELVSLPVELVSGSFNWSPRGDAVAFLTRFGSTVSLCAVRTDGSVFRYLADLPGESPMTYPPAVWSTDDLALTYSTPHQANREVMTLYADDLSGRPSRSRNADGYFPAVRGRELLTLARAEKGGGLLLRSLDERGVSRDIGALPLPPVLSGVRWDAQRAQALVTSRDSSLTILGGHSYWLVRWTAEVGE